MVSCVQTFGVIKPKRCRLAVAIQTVTHEVDNVGCVATKWVERLRLTYQPFLAGTPLADRLKQCAIGDKPLPFTLALLSPLPSLEPFCQVKGYYSTDFLAVSVHY